MFELWFMTLRPTYLLRTTTSEYLSELRKPCTFFLSPFGRLRLSCRPSRPALSTFSMPSPASTPSLLSTLHSLQAQLPTPSTASALLNPHSQTVPLSSTQAQLTRDGLRETIAGMRTSLEKFKALWEGSGEEGRVRAAGLMREM
jgi:hypothetical protein